MNRLRLPHGHDWAYGVLACVVLFAAPIATLPLSTLTGKDIDEAIRWGVTGSPTPYVLHHEDGRPGIGVSPGFVGAVYTPFLRVALGAKAARDRGDEFTRADVKAAWIEPVVYVAFRWNCCEELPPVDFKIAVPGDNVLRANSRLRVTTRPLWITQELSLLASFGGESPYSDTVLVAAYPISALSASPDFVIYREWPSARVSAGKDTALIAGRVTPDDLRRWR
jgi:hypothetical protein